MSFQQPWMLWALPLIALPIVIHLINQWRYQTRRWGAMMFLLAANRMNRGFAKIRQWLILALRVLALGGLVFAIARPLASGLLGLAGGGAIDTTIVILDRSPSMTQSDATGMSKLETGKRQLAGAFETLGSAHWVAIDGVNGQAITYDSPGSMLNSPQFAATSASSDLPSMLQVALDYVRENRPGPTDIWICSDLRAADWKADSGSWSGLRKEFQKLPQAVRFHLLAYAGRSDENLGIRVTEVRRHGHNGDTHSSADGSSIELSLQITRQSSLEKPEPIDVPVRVEIDGVRSELNVRLTGTQAEVRRHRIPLTGKMASGWGSVSIPSDLVAGDNDYYFVYSNPAPRRTVIVSENEHATRALEIAARIQTDRTETAKVEVLSPDQLDSLVLDQTALLLWQTTLPDQETAAVIEDYLNHGGQVVFFPPSRLSEHESLRKQQTFLGTGWKRWVKGANQIVVETWRGDSDLLAATASGAGLPVGQLEIRGYAELSLGADSQTLATLTGGAPLLVRVPHDQGGVYFITASSDPKMSSLADNGIVLYIAIQRSIERGLRALGNTAQQTAGETNELTGNWEKIAGTSESLSTEFGSHAGVYRNDDRLVAVNRSLHEDQRDVLTDNQLNALLEGLSWTRIDESAGSLAGIVREVWRLFLVAMIVALLSEAVLCIPRRIRPVTATTVAVNS